MLKKIDHLNIVVSDLSAAQEFFAALGFQPLDSARLTGSWIARIVGLDDVDADYVQLTLPGAETRLELIQFRNPPSGRESQMELANQLGFRHIAFAVEDIEAVVIKLKARGVEFLSEIQTFPKTGKRLVYFYGPDRILLELAQYR